MKVLSKLTIENLKQNKSRTIVTIVGIILSTAMLVCVFTLANSILSTYEAAIIESEGDYHVSFSNVPADEVNQISLNSQVETSYIMENRSDLSVSSMGNSEIEIWAFDENALKESENTLTEGRLPQNEGEILVGTSYDFIDVNIGDEIILSDENTYKVVGKTLYFQEIIMYMSEPKSEVQIYVKLKTLNNIDEFILSIIGEEQKYDVSINSDLIIAQSFNAMIDSKDDSMMFYMLVFSTLAVLVCVIIVVGAFCIRNSFAVSINEKIHQYAMIASVGATRKQLTENILLESLILGLFAIPIGATVGALSAFILVKVSAVFFSSMIEIVFCIAPFGVVFAILLSIFTILLSSISVAIRVSRSCEIDLIRNTNEIKITRKSTKAPKIIEKLFGISGVVAFKNIKRNKRKFRVTTVTLVVSIVAFIVVSYSVNLFYDKAMTEYSLQDEYNVSVSGADLCEALDYIVSLDDIQDYTVIYQAQKYFKPNDIKQDYKPVNVVALDHESYDKYFPDNSIVYAENKLIVYDQIQIWDEDSERITVNYLDYIGQKDVFEIAGVSKSTDERAFGYVKIGALPTVISLSTTNNQICVLMSQSQFEKYIEYDFATNTANNLSGVYVNLYINCTDAYTTTNLIEEYAYKNSLQCFPRNNIELMSNAELGFSMISIVSYVFIAIIILVGLTSIYNSLSSNIRLRKKEFAVLQSIGMTSKEFNKIISFVCIFYVLKSIFIGVPIATVLTFMIYKSSIGDTSYIYQIPLMQIIACSVVVFFIVYAIMKASLNKISKQNVIETIRQENT